MNYPQSPQHHTQSLDHISRPSHASAMASRSTSFDRRTRSDGVDSWIDVSSQPSSSSLSSIGDEIVTTGLRIQSNTRTGQRRAIRLGAPTSLNFNRTRSTDATSSQEEYEESESESDKVMQSSGDEPMIRMQAYRNTSMENANTPAASGASGTMLSDDDDENRTAINYPINNAATSFTPLPNAFSHPPSAMNRTTSQPVPGSYFPAPRPTNSRRTSARHSLPPFTENRRHSHVVQNPLSPSFNAAAEHEEVLRASLNSLLSVAAAARGLPKPESKRSANYSSAQQPTRSNQINTFRLVPESALPNPSPPALQEPTFQPTLRRTSTASASASTTSSQRHQTSDQKRKAPVIRSSSGERRSIKKARRSGVTSNSEDMHITPTLLTWFVSAGVVIVFSALSFTAGYGLGKEAGRLEAGQLAADEGLRGCAREAGRSGLGLRRSLGESLAGRGVMV
ncbi:hypothetical protein TI39_contig4125g00014 [Zymoseptoria brevis]|uniref:Uncharacterized protein n=1 Tax=Zymoseptoria brevis TaxID=1047168 RepID=A0A0F4GCZ0_9PEZI|nr:hypothetical protein TI39_contig4125g00014 [Zymoseptoria brevis]